MTEEARHILERRRLRRRLAWWRLLAIAVAVAAAGLVFGPDAARGPYVARHAIEGVILDDPARDDALRRVAEDRKARALLLRIDSPGGTVAGSEALYEALRAVAAVKPVVAVMGEAAASGGYIAALAADHIVARGATVTGSIGVVAEYPNIAGLLERVGVGFERVASAPLKAEPSPFRAPSADALAAQADLVEDAYRWFLGLVAERRGLDEAQLAAVGDGRVFSGRQALARGLIDSIGGEEAAFAWLAEARGVESDLPVRDVRVNRGPLGLVDRLTGARLADALADWARSPRLLAVAR